jgi:hypothetical protein
MLLVLIGFIAFMLIRLGEQVDHIQGEIDRIVNVLQMFHVEHSSGVRFQIRCRSHNFL